MAYIFEGRVSIGGKIIKKPGEKVASDSVIDFKNPDDEFVGRGAYKLLRAQERFDISFAGKICVDIGASTGGFTQLMLKCGAKRVVCVDVGTGVLHPKIKNDQRVTAFEQSHIKDFSLNAAGIDKADMIVCDVSFISVLKFIAKFVEFSHDKSEAVILIKPQFEAEAHEVKKGGVVLDKKIHLRIILNFIENFRRLGFFTWGLTGSPKLKGARNIEYLIFLKKNDMISYGVENNSAVPGDFVFKAIDEAFAEFGAALQPHGK
jgi:23S rRNA (cytidine1920-2'-O)/16S rRNA (cytidine1409-2'-O)-methyltransferase